MNRQYLVLIHGTIAARHITKLGALNRIRELALKGITAVLAVALPEPVYVA